MAKYLTAKEIADELRVSKMTVYRMAHSGALPSVRFGGSIRFPADAYHRWLEDQRMTSSSP